MRPILALIIILFCGGCYEEVKHSPDILGFWKFESSVASVEFEIIEDTFRGGYSMMSGSKFTLEGKTFTNTRSPVMSVSGSDVQPSIDFTDQMDSNNSTAHFLSLREVTFNDNKLTSKSYHYRACDCSDTKMITETVTLTRVKQ